MSAYPQQADPTKARLLNLKTGTTAIINRSATTIGRSPENDVMRSVDFAVSRQHALILNLRDSFYVEDVGSRNGTYLNGKPVTGRMSLKTGDLIGVGMTVLVFHGVWVWSIFGVWL